MSKAVAAVTTAEFEDQVLRADRPVLVDFWAAWCGPCRRVAPEVDAVAEKMEGSARVFKLDVDAEPDVAGRYGVQSIPTLLVFKNGQVVDQIVGAVSRTVLAEKLRAHTEGNGASQ